ncbi:alpha/beta hydrolase [Microbulbifer sp. SAOS-129_SWC]|uniref:alpha/beta hydrolase n=1 Tax=Microbulbifer sp. SAOS-129_SWC TaxID=3145235 RepID=UPI003217AC6C
MPRLPFHRPLFVRISNLLLKLLPAQKSIAGIALERQALSHGSLRIYRPLEGSSGAGLLWIHGGGMITGRAAQDDRLCSAWARQLGLSVFSIDYRLAPRHPFPAALDDCYEAWQWLLNTADRHGLEPTRIAIAGQSAGGGLAASLVQKIRDEGIAQPAALALFSPMLDDRTALRTELDALDHRIWNNKSNRAGWSAYLGIPAGAAEVPRYAVAARRKNLAGLPPTWIGVGGIDLFRAEAQEYARRLTAAGVHCRLHLAPMAPHAFETIAPDSGIARALYGDNEHFLRAALGLQDIATKRATTPTTS